MRQFNVHTYIATLNLLRDIGFPYHEYDDAINLATLNVFEILIFHQYTLKVIRPNLQILLTPLLFGFDNLSKVLTTL